MTKLEKEWIDVFKLVAMCGDELASPIAIITSVDVVRIVRRDFPSGQVAEVLKVLHEYGTDAVEWAPLRIRLAVLKRVAGNLESLKVIIRGVNRELPYP
jgi:hypothetical protein